MSETSIYVCHVATPEGFKDYITLTSPDAALSEGLIPQAILGVLNRALGPEEPITPDVVAPNSVFTKFLAFVIARHGPEQPGLVAEAGRIGKGHVFLVDQRTPTPQGPVPPEDILGAFRVEDGNVVPGSYMASPSHRLLTSNGFFQLDSKLMDCLQRELVAQSANRPGESEPKS
jgi:hypothetical protein